MTIFRAPNPRRPAQRNLRAPLVTRSGRYQGRGFTLPPVERNHGNLIGMWSVSEDLCLQVAREMRWAGVNAVPWDSGGGVGGIGIAPGDTPPDEIRFFFGTADSTWAGELLDENGDVAGSLATRVPSTSTDPVQIANAIMMSIASLLLTQHDR